MSSKPAWSSGSSICRSPSENTWANELGGAVLPVAFELLARIVKRPTGLGEARVQGGALLAERDKGGLRDLPRLRISESAVEGRRHVHRERGRGIGHRLLKRSRQHLFEVFLIPRPALLQGFIDGDARACLPVNESA